MGGRSLASKSRPDYIFLHSSFRTGSTWLWSRFRSVPDVCAYYEIYHPSLIDIEFRSLDSSPSSWNSHHSDDAKYFLEFIPLIEGKGVRYFDSRFTFEGFFPESATSPLAVSDNAYVQNLVATATQSGSYPVLSCTRSLGRVGALRENSNGYHIVIFRNLIRQWFSYSNQFASGNGFFLVDTLKNIETHKSKAPIDKLYEYAVSMGVDFDAPHPDDTAFILFVCYHVYLYSISIGHADLVFDITRASRDEKYRRSVEKRVLAGTGVSLRLDDARDRISNPFRIIQDRRATELSIRFLLERMSSAGTATQSLWESGATLIADMWKEYDAYVFYAGDDYRQRVDADNRLWQTEGRVGELAQAHEQGRVDLDVAATALNDARNQLAQVAHERELTDQKCGALLAQIDEVRSERDGLRAEVERTASALAELERTGAALAEERDALERARDAAVNASHVVAGELATANQAIADLITQRDALTQHRDELSAEIVRAGEERVQLAHQSDALTGAVVQANADIADLTAQREALTQHRDELSAEIVRAGEERGQLAQQNDALTGAVVQANADIADLTAQREALTQHRDGLAAEIALGAEARDGLMRDIEATRAENVEILAERDALKAAFDAQASALEEARRVSGDLTEDRDRLGQESAALSGEIEVVRSERDALQSQVRDLVVAAENANDRIRVSDEAQALLSREGEALRADRDRLQTDVARLELDLGQTRAALEVASAQAAALTDERDRLMRESDSLKADHDNIASDRDRLQGELDAATNDLGDAREVARQLTEERDHLSSEGGAIRNDRDRIQAEATALAERLDGAIDGTRRLTHERDQLATQIAALEADRATLETGLHALRTEHWQQTEKLGEAWHGLDKQAVELEAARTEVVTLGERLADGEAERSRHEALLTALSTALSDLAAFDALDPRSMSPQAWDEAIAAFELSTAIPDDVPQTPGTAAVRAALESLWSARVDEARLRGRTDYLRIFRGRSR